MASFEIDEWKRPFLALCNSLIIRCAVVAKITRNGNPISLQW